MSTSDFTPCQGVMLACATGPRVPRQRRRNASLEAVGGGGGIRFLRVQRAGNLTWQGKP